MAKRTSDSELHEVTRQTRKSTGRSTGHGSSSARSRKSDQVSSEELDLLIEEKQKELEYLEARSRRINASSEGKSPSARRTSSGTGARSRSSSAVSADRPVRRSASSGSSAGGNTERRKKNSDIGEARRRPSAAVSSRSKSNGTENGSSRMVPERNRRTRTSYDEDERYDDRERYDDIDRAEDEEPKEKPFFSERLIKVIGGLIGILIMFLVVFVVFGNKVKKTTVTSTETGETIELTSASNVLNILLVGQDGRDDVEGSRSDSMMICSVNKSTGQVKLISLMRDMYVSIPGYEDNRINASYSYGGIDLLKDTIEQDFQIQIDGNVQVDFESFKSIIDNLGGITINLSQEEADYLNYAYWQYGWTLTAGDNLLTGEQALAYSRTRQVGNSDFERTERQRNVLMTVFRQAKAGGILSMLNLARTIYPKLQTDIALGDMISLVTAAAGLSENDISTYRLPVDGSYTSETIRGMAVLVPDMDANRTYLKELIYGDSSDS